VDIEQAFGAQSGETRQGGKLSDTAEWLRNILLDGPMEADQLEVEAKGCGHFLGDYQAGKEYGRGRFT